MSDKLIADFGSFRLSCRVLVVLVLSTQRDRAINYRLLLHLLTGFTGTLKMVVIYIESNHWVSSFREYVSVYVLDLGDVGD
jgi:hypothetical protein